MASSFASLYCGLLEKEVILNQLCNPFLPSISNWRRRYIDDFFFFFIWTDSETQLKQFRDFINTNSIVLKFTIDFDKHMINFLDILVYRELNRLGSNLYRKSTNRNSILHGQSFHPIPLKRSLPLSQFSHICRICSSESDFQGQAANLEKRFQQRQYKHEWITK